MAQGHSIRQTARALGIAPKTVENVQTRLFRKLGVRNRSGALAVAERFGLLPAPTPAADDVVALVTRPAAIPLPGLPRAPRARDKPDLRTGQRDGEGQL